MLANHAGAPPQYSIIHRAFEEVSPGAVFFDLPSNPFTCAPQACQNYHCMECTVGGKWFHTRFLHSWAGCCEQAYGLEIVAVALIGENSVLRYGSRDEIAEKLGVNARIITGVPHYFYIFKNGAMQADVLRFGMLKIQAVVADGLTEAEEREKESLLEEGATGRKRKRKKREGAGAMAMRAENIAKGKTKAKLYNGVKSQVAKFFAVLHVYSAGKTICSSFCDTAEQAAWEYNKILLANRNKLPRFNLEKLNHVEGYNFNTLPGYKEAKEAAGRMFSAKLK